MFDIFEYDLKELFIVNNCSQKVSYIFCYLVSDLTLNSDLN